jgi:hypothetical protein
MKKHTDLSSLAAEKDKRAGQKRQDKRDKDSVNTPLPTGLPVSDAQVLARIQEILRVGGTGTPLADDLIWSARAIAFEIYGKGDAKHQRKVFHLFATSRTPIVKIGSTYVVRRSTLRRWIEQMEQQGLSGKRGIPPILSTDRYPRPDDPKSPSSV